MTDNPYSHRNDHVHPDLEDDGPERTSGSAIAALVLSLSCCLSPIGLVTGIISLISISASGGRVKGRGLAVASIVIGLIASVILGAVVAGSLFGARAAVAQFIAAGQVMQAVEDGDFDAARGGLVPPAADASDAAFEAFRDAYQAQVGRFVSVPGEISGLTAYGEVGAHMQAFQGRENVIPVPALFDQGRQVIGAVIDPNATPTQAGGGGMPTLPFADLVVVLADGTEIALTDFLAAGGPAEVEDADSGEADGGDAP